MIKIFGKVCVYIRIVFNILINRYESSLFKKIGNKFSWSGGIASFSNISIGDNVYIGPGACFLSTRAEIFIGNNVMFGPNVMMVTGNHRIDVVGEYMINIKEEEKLSINDEDIIIEDDVWIGIGVIILKGVTIGKGSVIGAGSVIVKNIPPYTIHVGSGNIKEYKRFTDIDIVKHEKIIRDKYENAK